MNSRLLLAWLLPLTLLQAEEPIAKNSNGIGVQIGKVLDYDAATFEQLAGSYTLYSGYSLKIPEELKPLNIRVFARGPLTNADIARLIENSFLLNGYIIKRAESGDLHLARGAGPWRRPHPLDQRMNADPDPKKIVIPKDQAFAFENLTAFECAGLISTHTGKRVLLSSSVASAELSINAPGPLTNEQVAEALTVSLEKHGMILKDFTPHEAAILAISPGPTAKPPSGRVRRVRRVPNQQ